MESASSASDKAEDAIKTGARRRGDRFMYSLSMVNHAATHRFDRRLFLLTFLLTGCAPATWRVQAPDESLAATEVTAEDLGISDAPPAAQVGQSLLAASTGVSFPTGLAVARVFAGPDGRSGRSLRVAVSRPDREAYWSQLVNDLSDVREVIVMGRYGLNPDGFRREDALHRARLLGCNLCLIYARIEGVDCEYAGEYAGVLWDSNQSRKLASYQVPVQIESDDGQTDNPDNVAEARLRAEVRQTLWELAGKREPSISTRPSPWRTNEPLFPRGQERHHYIERAKP
jgi:hypothetical protein